MSDAQFQTFMTGGLGLLVVSAIAIAWLLWRDRDERSHCAVEMLSGVSHEYRLNVHQMLSELMALAEGSTLGPSALLPITHPQMDGVNRSQIEANRRALAVMGASYQELGSRKMELRSALSQGEETGERLEEAIDACIDGVATLYLWDEHCGAAPTEARSTRSWAVRDWMKLHGFGSIAFPGMHFRDEVVERLRQYGMDLKPKPLTHTAAEYYAMQYDRQADPRGVFGKRRFKKDKLAQGLAAIAEEQPSEAEIDDEIEETQDAMTAASVDESVEVGDIADSAVDEDALAEPEEISDAIEEAEEAEDAMTAASVDESIEVEDIADSVVDEIAEETAEVVDEVTKRTPIS